MFSSRFHNVVSLFEKTLLDILSRLDINSILNNLKSIDITDKIAKHKIVWLFSFESLNLFKSGGHEMIDLA